MSGHSAHCRLTFLTVKVSPLSTPNAEGSPDKQVQSHFAQQMLATHLGTTIIQLSRIASGASDASSSPGRVAV